ncbi:ATPase AAA [Thermodesulfomicrobium sp. WS]|uniref:ATP-binding protein n=1 Tax=Thermodesulfomicrobium sp. WS TaxID=3004129 RepID=UPI00248FD6E9|nr:ATP-binding protein [Thermodesulfomicrobium sp. WS]BDV00222.1 ATPase AAA [Thermodesulfomicrobium sp. WS]
MRHKLPIGIQSFAQIRHEGFYYVDKTPFIAQLATGKFYFLSRPRRFGKSLLLDTIAEAFAGNRTLFTADTNHHRPALYLADHWDWERRFAVIRLSFAIGPLATQSELEEYIHYQLTTNAARLKVEIDPPAALSLDLRLAQLITRAAEIYAMPAVVLVDEYDKPILDHITNIELASEMRETLKRLYSVLKDTSAALRFVLLTGVSKFSQVSIFSGLNNLRDITISEEFGAICGYSDADLDTIFAPEFEAAAAAGRPLDRDLVRQWYNGYWWGGPQRMYNPYDVLLMFAERQFRPWWFETSTPTFLIELLKTRRFFTPKLAQMRVTPTVLGSFDVDHIRPEALLWQTGYLTIKGVQRQGALPFFELGVPNLEVSAALNDSLLEVLVPHRDTEATIALVHALAAGDADAVHAELVRLFERIPYDWPLAAGDYEGYYASVFFSFLASTGAELTPESHSREGRVDLVAKMQHTVWIFEFKVISGESPTGEALRQIQQRHYAAPYRNAPGVHRVIEVGVEFSKTKHQIIGWEVAAA